jgi:hypothetical protein
MSFRRLTNINVFLLIIVAPFVTDVPAQPGPAKSRQTARPVTDLKNEATNVANNYWNQRFTKCGELTVWASLRQARSGKVEFVFFQSKDKPAIVLEEVPKSSQEKSEDSNSQPVEWKGTSHISIKSAQDIYSATSPIKSTWLHRLIYAVTIQKVEGEWEIVEDKVGERVVAHPLFADVSSPQPVIIENCLQAGGDPNMRNASGETLLLTAASRGSVLAVRELLGKKADPNLKHPKGWTASYLARLNNHKDVAQLIDQAGGICEGPIKSVCAKYPKL